VHKDRHHEPSLLSLSSASYALTSSFRPPLWSLIHCCVRPRDRFFVRNSNWLNGSCSDVYECSKNAVGLQNTANQPERRTAFQTGRSTPYVVLRLADRICDAPARTSNTELCSRRPKLQSAISHLVHYVKLTSLHRSFLPIVDEPARVGRAEYCDSGSFRRGLSGFHQEARKPGDQKVRKLSRTSAVFSHRAYQRESGRCLLSFNCVRTDLGRGARNRRTGVARDVQDLAVAGLTSSWVLAGTMPGHHGQPEFGIRAWSLRRSRRSANDYRERRTGECTKRDRGRETRCRTALSLAGDSVDPEPSCRRGPGCHRRTKVRLEVSFRGCPERA
jgi:hypothetical protein